MDGFGAAITGRAAGTETNSAGTGTKKPLAPSIGGLTRLSLVDEFRVTADTGTHGARSLLPAKPALIRVACSSVNPAFQGITFRSRMTRLRRPQPAPQK